MNFYLPPRLPLNCEQVPNGSFTISDTSPQTPYTAGTAVSDLQMRGLHLFHSAGIYRDRDPAVSSIHGQLRYAAHVFRHLDQTPKRVFGLVIDFGTSQSPKSTRPLTTYLCPSRPGHQALRNNFASSLLLRTWLPMTGRRVWMPTFLPLWRYAHDR